MVIILAEKCLNLIKGQLTNKFNGVLIIIAVLVIVQA